MKSAYELSGSSGRRISPVSVVWIDRQGWKTSAHVRDFMARAGANGLGTIPNLKKMAAFLKSFAWRTVYGEKVEPHWKR